jgi:hypothetical protein
MNAYELAKKLEWYTNYDEFVEAGAMLRQQADRIAKLESYLEAYKTRVAELEKETHSINYTCPNCETHVELFYKTPQIKELSDKEIKPLLDRIQNYLEFGGLFNPECMEHDKVRDLIMDCKAILKKASEK